MTKIFGIKNCDTMKKALKWLDEKGADYEFHDYKKTAPDTDVLKQAITEHGWETVINRRGTTWRNLPEQVQNVVNDESAIALALENPSIIKRPLLVKDEKTHLGFKAEEYDKLF